MTPPTQAPPSTFTPPPNESFVRCCRLCTGWRSGIVFRLLTRLQCDAREDLFMQAHLSHQVVLSVCNGNGNWRRACHCFAGPSRNGSMTTFLCRAEYCDETWDYIAQYWYRVAFSFPYRMSPVISLPTMRLSHRCSYSRHETFAHLRSCW